MLFGRDDAFGLMLLVVGLTTAFKVFRLWRRRSAPSWPTTTGHLISAELLHDEGYYLEIRYRYTVDDRDYELRVHPPGRSTFRGDTAAKLYAYRKGQAVAVFYNPCRPQEALLNPTFNQKGFVGGIAVSVAALAGALKLLTPL